MIEDLLVGILAKHATSWSSSVGILAGESMITSLCDDHDHHHITMTTTIGAPNY